MTKSKLPVYRPNTITGAELESEQFYDKLGAIAVKPGLQAQPKKLFVTPGPEKYKVDDAPKNKHKRKQRGLKQTILVPLVDPVTKHPFTQTSIDGIDLERRLDKISDRIDVALRENAPYQLTTAFSGKLDKRTKRKKLRPNTTLKPLDEPSPITVHAHDLREEGEPSPAHLKQTKCYFSCDEEIDKWIESYETDKAKFNSFTLLTEVKLDQVAFYSQSAGHPNVIEAAACCAALSSMPGILRSYETLLKKIARGVEYAIYGECIMNRPDSPCTANSHRDNVADIVKSFYKRTPIFVRAKELETEIRLAREHPVHRGDETQDETSKNTERPPEQEVVEDLSQVCKNLRQVFRQLNVFGREVVLKCLIEMADIDLTIAVLKELDAEDKASIFKAFLLDGNTLKVLSEILDPAELLQTLLKNVTPSQLKSIAMYVMKEHVDAGDTEMLNMLCCKLNSDEVREKFVRQVVASSGDNNEASQRSHMVSNMLLELSTEEMAEAVKTLSSHLTQEQQKQVLSVDKDAPGFPKAAVRNPFEHINCILNEAIPEAVAQIDLLHKLLQMRARDAPKGIEKNEIEEDKIQLTAEEATDSMLKGAHDEDQLSVSNQSHDHENSIEETIEKNKTQDTREKEAIGHAEEEDTVATANRIETQTHEATEVPAKERNQATETQKTKDNFEEFIMKLSPDERAAFFTTLCQDIPEVRTLVQVLNENTTIASTASDPMPADPKAVKRAVSKVFETFDAEELEKVQAALNAQEDPPVDYKPRSSSLLATAIETKSWKDAQETHDTGVDEASTLIRKSSESHTELNLPKAAVDVEEKSCQTDFIDDNTQLDDIDERGSSRGKMKKSIGPPHEKLVLSDLLKKSGKKVLKISPNALPPPYAALITSWKMNPDLLSRYGKKTIGSVLKTIGDVYSEKIRRDRKAKDQNSKLKRLSLAETTYQIFLQTFGLPTIADVNLVALVCSLDQYRDQHPRIERFAQFSYSEEELPEEGLYLGALELIVEYTEAAEQKKKGKAPLQRRKSSQPVGGNIRFNVSDDVDWMVPLERALDVCQATMNSMRNASVNEFGEKLTAEAMELVDAPEADKSILHLNVDLFLDYVLDEWEIEEKRRSDHIRNVFIACDVNGDGQLTSAEFSSIILAIDKQRDPADVLMMYSDTLRRTGCDTIDTATFIQVAKEHGLLQRAWLADTELSSIINSTEDFHHFWESNGHFVVGTIQSLCRDIPKEDDLLSCKGAGCGCLQCLLDCYLGFEQIRKNATPEEHGVLWGRFWQLMQMLYALSSDCDGVLTAWENGPKIRTTPAPALACRVLADRRHALPNVVLPDPNRVTACVTYDPIASPADALAQYFEAMLRVASDEEEEEEDEDSQE